MSRNGRSFEISEPCCKCDFIKDEYGKWIEVENNRTGGVYFIRCGNAVKIGMANDVKKRLDGLQTANHEKLELLAVIKTVNKDVEITRNLFYFAKENGYLKYIDKAGETKTVELEVTL
ncbi:MAG TPA: GIY-YIG nuclease family protein [Bacteroidales bacterium]|nr:GIY-YIG nuclease family protein [Bacteroidales bacterium]